MEYLKETGFEDILKEKEARLKEIQARIKETEARIKEKQTEKEAILKEIEVIQKEKETEQDIEDFFDKDFFDEYIRETEIEDIIKKTAVRIEARIKEIEFVNALTKLLSKSDNIESLSQASAFGNLEAVKYLVEDGADIEYKQNGFTPLIWASIYGYIDIVKFLVEKGSDIEATKSEFGWTALMYASKEGYLEIVKYLVERGANIEVKDNDGKTASILALMNDNVEIVEYLKLITNN